MATAADEIVHVYQTPTLAKLFMAGVVLAMLACVAAMLPFLTGRTHGFICGADVALRLSLHPLGRRPLLGREGRSQIPHRCEGVAGS